MKKIFFFFLGLILTIGLTTTLVFASDLDKSSEASTKLPYLAPNLEDAALYGVAEKITENTKDATYDIDDIYTILTSVRTYYNNTYQLKVYDSAVLSALQDLNGYNTAYNTHSMLMDMWMRIGCNSSLGNTYNITDMLADIDDVLNDNLYITDGQEGYTLAEMIAGIYGQFSTPRSIPDLYNKLSSIDTYVGTINTYVQNANSYLYSMDDAILRLADIYASQDVADAKAAQQQYEDESIADFTGSGTGAATTANKNDIKGISSTVKQGLNTGGNASNALGVFSFDTTNDWSWFTQTTADNLDTSFVPPSYILVYDGNMVVNGSYQKVQFTSPDLAANNTYKITISVSNSYNARKEIRIIKQNGSYDSYYLERGETSTTIDITPTLRIKTIQLQDGTQTARLIVLKEDQQTRIVKSNNNYIPDFITNHDNQYFNLINGNER